MKTVKIAAMFMVVLMALSVTGVAYSHWRDSLYVDVTVQTGEVDVKWSLNADSEEIFSNDPYNGEPQGSGHVDPGLECSEFDEYDHGDWVDKFCSIGRYVNYEKDVAYTHVWRETNANYGDGEEYNKLWIEFRRVYPSYAPMVSMWVDNIGTIPVYFEYLEFAFSPDNGVTWLYDQDAHFALDQYGCELIAWCVTLDNVKQGAGSKGDYEYLPFVVDADEENMGIYCMYNLIDFLKTVKIHPEEALDVHLIFHFQQEMEQGIGTGVDYPPKILFTMNPTFCQYNLVEDTVYQPLWP